MNHTPTPWIRADIEDYPGSATSICSVAEPDRQICDITSSEDDIDFVLRAVNCHDELVEALDKAASIMEDIAKGVKLTGDNLALWALTTSVLLPKECTKARAVLAKAKGE
jgi:hypothetical protein